MGFCVASTVKSGGSEYVWVPSETEPLFHDLQERGLGLRRGPVDLVGQQDRGEDRPPAQLEGLRGELKDLGTQDIGRHQVRRELDPLELRVEQPREALRQQGLAQTGYPFEQHMAARVQRGQKLIEHVVLSEEDPAQAGLEPARVFMKLCEFHRSVSEAGSVRSPVESRPSERPGAPRLRYSLRPFAGAPRRRAGIRPRIGRAGEAGGATASTTRGAARARS